MINGHGLLLPTVPVTQRCPTDHGSPGHHLSKGCASAVSVVLLKPGSFIIVSFLFAFVFVSLSPSLFGVSHIFQVSLSTCAMKDAFVSRSGEDFMPLPGDFKLINHIKCFAVPSPESRVGPDSSRNCVKANY